MLHMPNQPYPIHDYKILPCCSHLFLKINLEVPTGLEPVNGGFAIHCLTNLAKEPQRII